MPEHIELSIIKGIGAVEGDTQSAEKPAEVLSLLDARGFSVAADGWVPKLAQVKSNAVYADNPLTDGRTLIANARGNVVEQIKLTASGATWDARYWLESKLAKLSRDAQDFHTGLRQIEPVYLKWWANGAPGPQYALIHSIDIARNTPAFLPVNINELQITIERDPYWMGEVPPGGNPKLWTRYIRQASTYIPNIWLRNQVPTPETWAQMQYSAKGTGATVTKVEETTDYGKYVLRCSTGTDTDAGLVFGNDGGGASGNLMLYENKQYTSIAWVRGSAASGVPVKLEVKVPGGAVLATSAPVNLSTSWQQLKVTYTTGAFQNPHLYRIVKDNNATNVTFDATGFALWPGTYEEDGHFITAEVSNRNEFKAGMTGFVSWNFIDIPAEDIPGDAPALAMITFPYKNEVDGVRRVFVGQSLNRTSITNRLSESFLAFNIFNAVDGGNSGQANNAGGVYPIGGANKQIVSRTLAGSGQSLLSWSNSAEPVPELNLFRGRYAAYFRCRQTSGSEGGIKVKLIVQTDSDLSEVSLEEKNAFVNSSDGKFGIVYLGSFAFPPDAARATSSLNGMGLHTHPKGGRTYLFSVILRNTTGGNLTIECLDLILVAIDVNACVVGNGLPDTIDIKNHTPLFVLDNTGYTTHGQLMDYARIERPEMDSSDFTVAHTQPLEVRGRLPVLYPKQNNRLYFLFEHNHGAAVINQIPASDPNLAYTVCIDIIPRWLGIRDV